MGWSKGAQEGKVRSAGGGMGAGAIETEAAAIAVATAAYLARTLLAR